MKCPECGKELQERAHFCPYCMASLDRKKPVPGAAPTPRWRRMLPVILAAACVLLTGAVLFFALRGCVGEEPLPAPSETNEAASAGRQTGTAETKAPVTADPVETNETDPETSPDPTGEEPGGATVPTSSSETPPTSSSTKPPATSSKSGGETPHVHTAVTDAAVAPTCTKAGKTAGSHCSVCGEVIEAQTTLPATGHTAVTDPAVAATCTAAGKTAGSHCSVCGAILTAQQSVPKTEHQYRAATYSEPETCAVCGATRGSPLAAPPITVEINSGSGFPRKSSYNGNLRINSKPTVETVYNGDGTYTVKVTVNVTNISSSTSYIGGIPAKIGYLSARDADDGWGGELKPGETGTKGAIFYNVPGGGTFGGVYYVTI